jgi:hypothetical protein
MSRPKFMKRLAKHKSNRLSQAVGTAFLMLIVANPVHAIEGSGRFGNGPRIAQAPAAAEPATRVQSRNTDATLCRDILGLYLNVSSTTFASKVAAEVLLETIARHESMGRLITMATASGCELRPFLDEEVRRNKH